ncbi:MAG: type I-C CRISPR-associated endonuclease Cas1 [Clostridia bacterium]|nr:type I-C CRISPR-associated endonuclease Cas1 [Clostridia bacterium]
MRKLLNTLYVTTEDAYLALENENVVVHQGEERKGQYPLLMLEGIVSFSYRGASPALMGECAKRGISLCFMTQGGRFLARVTGEAQGNVLLRRQQFRLADGFASSCFVARHFIFGKVYNSRWLIERTLRDHALRVDAEALRKASRQLADQLESISACENLDTLRGIEGELSARYFGVFDQLILNQKDGFRFDTRSRRPPEDAVNAMLSFAYTLLAHDCAAALEGVGLDACVGFMHRDRPGRRSLALDLMEELRPVFADRLVLTLINTREIQPKHFRKQAGGVVLLNDEGRKILLNAWQTRKREEITHPYLKEKLAWGLVPHVQALLLARHIRGDLDGYPPFLWK